MNTKASTVDLLAQARAGDGQAMEMLLRRYREYVRLIVQCKASGRLQARVDSSDLIQETLLRAAKHFRQFQGASEEAWRGWLARIAEHEIIRQCRHHLGAEKRAAGREQRLVEGGGSGHSHLDGWVAKVQSSPSLAAQRKERAALLADLLANLPDDYRQVLVLRHLEGLEFTEVARRLERSPGAVRVLWTRALKKLQEVIKGHASLE